MSYSKKEIKILLSNPYVDDVKYGNRIEYKDCFKRWAIKMSMEHPEISAIDIFKMAGFDENIISSEKARRRICYWKKSYLYEKINKNIRISEDNKKNNEILISLYRQFSKLIDILERDNFFD